MKSIDIIVEPERVDRYKKGIKYSFPNCAAVILLRTDDDKNILVDTGGYGHQKRVVDGLRRKGLNPEDIHYVILTHSHFDHNANIYLFSRAQLIQERWLVSIADGKTIKYGRKEELPPIGAKGIRLIKTPGHTEDSISVLVRHKNKKYAIVGDAVKGSLIRAGLIKREYSNSQDYLNNMKKLFRISNVIISGDDGLIEGETFTELKKLLKNVKIER